MQVRPFCLQHSKTFYISHAFLTGNAELSTLKQVRFLAHPVYYDKHKIICNNCSTTQPSTHSYV